jgi:hypothetical protein
MRQRPSAPGNLRAFPPERPFNAAATSAVRLLTQIGVPVAYSVTRFSPPLGNPNRGDVLNTWSSAGERVPACPLGLALPGFSVLV